MTDFYLLDEKLTDDERGIRDRLRDFCATEVTPVINGYWERAEFPFELVPKIARLQMVVLRQVRDDGRDAVNQLRDVG